MRLFFFLFPLPGTDKSFIWCVGLRYELQRISFVAVVDVIVGDIKSRRQRKDGGGGAGGGGVGRGGGGGGVDVITVSHGNISIETKSAKSLSF